MRASCQAIDSVCDRAPGMVEALHGLHRSLPTPESARSPIEPQNLQNLQNLQNKTPEPLALLEPPEPFNLFRHQLRPDHMTGDRCGRREAVWWPAAYAIEAVRLYTPKGRRPSARRMSGHDARHDLQRAESRKAGSVSGFFGCRGFWRFCRFCSNGSWWFCWFCWFCWFRSLDGLRACHRQFSRRGRASASKFSSLTAGRLIGRGGGTQILDQVRRRFRRALAESLQAKQVIAVQATPIVGVLQGVEQLFELPICHSQVPDEITRKVAPEPFRDVARRIPCGAPQLVAEISMRHERVAGDQFIDFELQRVGELPRDQFGVRSCSRHARGVCTSCTDLSRCSNRPLFL